MLPIVFVFSVFSLDTFVGLLVATDVVTSTVGFCVGFFVGLFVTGEGLVMASYNADEYSDRHATTEKHPSPLSQTPAANPPGHGLLCRHDSKMA